jgi:hypothetical protein
MDRAKLIAAMEAAATVKPKAVQAFGETVYVRALTVAEVEEQTADAEAKKDKARIARGVARVLCDESGTRLFDPDSAADVALISKQPWAALRTILAASNVVNGDGSGAAEKPGNA